MSTGLTPALPAGGGLPLLIGVGTAPAAVGQTLASIPAGVEGNGIYAITLNGGSITSFYQGLFVGVRATTAPSALNSAFVTLDAGGAAVENSAGGAALVGAYDPVTDKFVVTYTAATAITWKIIKLA